MVRSISPIDFDLALEVLQILSANPGLTKNQIIEKLKFKEGSSKIDSIITDFNESHLNLVKKEKGNRYFLIIPIKSIPTKNSSKKTIIDFWKEYFRKFPLYIEIVQSFSFGNTIKEVSKFTGISLVSTRELVRWAEMVEDLRKVKKECYRITTWSIEELLNRIAVCHLGILGCTKIEREKEIKRYGFKADVYGSNKNKEFYIESESSALKLNEGIMQVKSWVSIKNKRNIEKWVLIPKETLKEETYNNLIKRYNLAKDNDVQIKVCNLVFRKRPKINSFKIPGSKDKEIFNEIIKILKIKEFITLDDTIEIILKILKKKEAKEINENLKKKAFQMAKAFINRMRKFSLLIKKPNNIYIQTFKI